MSKLKRTLLAVGMGGIIGLMIVGVLIFAQYYMQGRLPAGTRVAGISLTFLKTEDAIEKLNQETDTYLNSPIPVSVGDRDFSVKPKNLGLDMQVEETVNKIVEAESGNDSIFKFYIPNKSRQKDLIVETDEKQLFTELENRTHISEVAPSPANFYLDESQSLGILEERAGFALNKEAVLEQVEADASALEARSIALKLSHETPVLTFAKLEEHKEEMKERLRTTLTLGDPVYSDDWNEKLIDHLDWVYFSADDEAQKVAIMINQKNLNKFLDAEVSKWLDDPVDPVNIYRDENENVVIEGSGHNGMKIEREQLKKDIEVALETGETDLVIPISEIIPEVNVSEDLLALGIKERLGVGHTSYYGSRANRVHNIKNGSSKFNVVLVAPGETFSFNNTLGPVDGSTGYRKELVIKKEGTVPEFGGGICQVSTTMYRAILFSGLPIAERNPHTYAVSYYSQVLGHGLDATIYLGGSDLKWVNDTENHILIQAYTKDDYELYFVFYGTSDGRSVEMEGPYIGGHHSPGATVYIDTNKLPPGEQKQVEVPHVGFYADWYRYITDAEGNTTKEYLPTKYKAVPAKVWVGIDPNAEEGGTAPAPET